MARRHRLHRLQRPQLPATSSALLDELGVARAAVGHELRGHRRRGDFEYSGASPNGLFAKRAHLVTPWFHRMIADLVRFNRDAPRAAARRRRRAVARRTGSSERRYSRAVRRAADRAAGVGRVVGRPAADVDVPGALPGRVLRQPRDARAPRPAAVADGHAAARARYVEALDRAVRATALRLGDAGRARSTRDADHVDGHAARRRARALRRGRARRRTPTRRCAMLADADATASTRSSARSRTSPTRRSCTPTARCCRAAGARGRAGTTTCSPSRPATHDRHLPHEPPAVAATPTASSA